MLPAIACLLQRPRQLAKLLDRHGDRPLRRDVGAFDEQQRVKGTESGPRRGAELLSQRRPQTLVDAEGVRDVSTLREHAHEELVPGLVQRSELISLAGRGLGGRPVAQLQ